MRESALASILLVKAVEETDGEGTLLPVADRAAATREAARGREDAIGAASLESPTGALSSRAQQLLAARAQLLHARLTARFPVVDSAVTLTRGPWWVGVPLLVLGAGAGLSLSALDGSRRINVLAFPLLGLVLWSTLVYLSVGLRWIRSLVRPARGPGPLARLVAEWGRARIRRVVARSAAFNVPLAGALGRFVVEWYAVAGPTLVARATRGLHLAAAAAGLGLIAGFYLRGLVLHYEAGWESTFLTAEQARSLLRIAYGPASWLTGIPVPDAAQLAAIRWPGARGGESAAPWIHLLAATALLFVVLPRLGLALGTSLVVWRRALRTPLPPSLPPYFHRVFGRPAGGTGRGIVAVVPYAYAPTAATAAALARLLPTALGEHLAVDMRAPVRYGEEDEFIEHLAERGGAVADVIALLFTLAATPEDQNHGTMIAGVRDWLAASRRQAQLLVLVDEGPYAARMGGPAGPAHRLVARRGAWAAFVAARGLTACVADLGAPAPAEAVECVRAARWQPAPA